jgi:hypothetical protein
MAWEDNPAVLAHAAEGQKGLASPGHPESRPPRKRHSRFAQCELYVSLQFALGYSWLQEVVDADGHPMRVRSRLPFETKMA